MSKITEAAEQLETATKQAEGNQPEPAEDQSLDQQEGNEPQPKASGDLIDLDAQDKFIWQGKEYTPEDLNKAVLMQSDYTKKTQALAEERKFYDNLEYDLDNVLSGLASAEDFKKIYPEKFHGVLDRFLKQTQQVEEPTSQDQSEEPESLKVALKKIEELENKLGTYDNKFREEKIEAEQAHLDVIFEKYSDKYDFADEDAVVNHAQRMLEENRDNPNFQFTEGVWERLFKRDHEMRLQKFNEYEKRRQKAQLDKSRRGSDGGPGGEAPGRERKKMTFDEATEMAIQDLGR